MTQLEAKEVRGLMGHFSDLPDPRSTVNRRHVLVDVIVISICAVIAGADGPVGIAEWANAQREWLKKYLRLPHGIPSHDTFGRVLESLDPEIFQKCFAAWLESISDQIDADTDEAKEKHYAIDGKTIRRSHDRRNGLGPLHLVSVWATQHGMSLGQIATEEKSNEITAIPQLLDRLELENSIVTIDAAGCQKNIAEKIVAKGGDYVLALKGNQESLYQAVQEYFDAQVERDFVGVQYSDCDEEDKSHGRLDKRYY